jgi:hypothetical protein
MRSTSIISTAILAILAGGAAWTEEDEKKVTIDQVPAAVKTTILAQANGAPITEIEEETKHGKTIYEAEFTANGVTTEVKVAADGTLLKTKVEKEDKEDGEDEKGEHEGHHKK